MGQVVFLLLFFILFLPYYFGAHYPIVSAACALHAEIVKKIGLEIRLYILITILIAVLTIVVVFRVPRKGWDGWLGLFSSS